MQVDSGWAVMQLVGCLPCDTVAVAMIEDVFDPCCVGFCLGSAGKCELRQCLRYGAESQHSHGLRARRSWRRCMTTPGDHFKPPAVPVSRVFGRGCLNNDACWEEGMLLQRQRRRNLTVASCAVIAQRWLENCGLALFGCRLSTTQATRHS